MDGSSQGGRDYMRGRIIYLKMTHELAGPRYDRPPLDPPQDDKKDEPRLITSNGEIVFNPLNR